MAIRARDECIRQIEAFSQAEFSDPDTTPSKEVLDKIVNYLTNLRQLSIYAVD
jgi:hypothetical protein